jgi:hypothetical protein
MRVYHANMEYTGCDKLHPVPPHGATAWRPTRERPGRLAANAARPQRQRFTYRQDGTLWPSGNRKGHFSVFPVPGLYRVPVLEPEWGGHMSH